MEDSAQGCLEWIYGKVNMTNRSGEECLHEQAQFVETMNANCQIFQLTVSFFLIGVMCVLGLIGNVLSMLTLQKDNMHTVTVFLLSALCVADIGFILPAFIVIMLPSYCEYFQQHCAFSLRQTLMQYIEQYGWAVVSFAHTCTVYMTVLVAVHRYFFVCRPHDCHRLSGLIRARRQAAVIPLASLLFNLPRVFEYKVRTLTMRNLEANITYQYVETTKHPTWFADNMWFQVLYKNVLYCLLMFAIPLTLLVVLSLRLLRQLHMRRVSRSKYNRAGARPGGSERRQKQRDDNITFVLVIIIGVFVVCQAPLLAQRLLLATSIDENAHHCGHAYFYVEQAANFFAVLNSCVNFAIYFLFARRFRLTLVNDVLRCPTRRVEMHEMRTKNGAIETDEKQCKDGESLEKLEDSVLTVVTDTPNTPLIQSHVQHTATSTADLEFLSP